MDDFKDNSVTKEQQENDENPDAGIEAEVSGTTGGATEPDTGKKTSEEKVSRGLLGKRAAELSPTDMQPELKKQKQEEIKTQDVANAAPPQAEGSASKKQKQEQEVPKTPPGTSKTSTGPGMPPGKQRPTPRFSPYNDMLWDSIKPSVNFTSDDEATESESGSDTEDEFRRAFEEAMADAIEAEEEIEDRVQGGIEGGIQLAEETAENLDGHTPEETVEISETPEETAEKNAQETD